jgi:hypothetical protein
VSPLWLIPGVVVLLGSAMILALVRSAGEEARLLVAELRRQQEVAEGLRRLRDAMRTLSLPSKSRR